MLLSAVSLLLQISSAYLVSAASCGCSAILIPVHVDTLVPKDPTDIWGGLKSNASALRRVDETYDIYGVFCQPNTAHPKNADVVQLLVHGITYDSQYWSPPVEEFRNYSYAAFACDRGLPTLAVDVVGVGLSTRPVSAADVQCPTASAALSQVARHLKSAPILPGLKPFKKVIGIGHSAGSELLNFGAIVDTPSPFDGLILTGALNIAPSVQTSVALPPSARDVDPLRWSGLDPAYITAPNRTIFYPADPNSFSPRMFIFDGFTKDVGTVSIFLQTPITTLTTRFTGPVAKVVGAGDQFLCAQSRCVDVAALTAAERVGWPEAQSFEVVVSPGSGHDLNLDFFAQGPFNIFVNLAEQFSAI